MKGRVEAALALISAGAITTTEQYIEVITFGMLKERMTVQDWDNAYSISEADALAYPNARTAYELQQSPLYKALI